MNKSFLRLVPVLVLSLLLSACGCEHTLWNEAGCEIPRTCAECGKTEGEPLGHTWAAATCKAPQTCTHCGKTEGEPAPAAHSWLDATCEAPGTCSLCGKEEGEPLGHDWQPATTELPMTCARCSAAEGERIVTDPRFTTAATAGIQGKWGAFGVLSGQMLNYPDFQGEVEYLQILELGNDGSITVSIALTEADDFYRYLADTLYAELVKSGASKDQADAAILQTTQMTVEQYVRFLFETVDLNTIRGNLEFSGVYYVSDGCLYRGPAWDAEMLPCPFTYDGTTLTLADGAESTAYLRIAET